MTFSGDTTKSDNLITLARDTDILVHEAQFSLDDAYYHNRFPPNYLQKSGRHHVFVAGGIPGVMLIERDQ